MNDHCTVGLTGDIGRVYFKQGLTGGKTHRNIKMYKKTSNGWKIKML